MDKIIGYKQAKALMLEGCKVQESPRFHDSHVAHIKTPEGKLTERIRSDSWDKLRKECRMVEKTAVGGRSRDAQYIWELKPNE